MRPTRPTGLLLLFALVCFVYAWMMNIGEAVAAGFGILVFLAIRAWFFQTAVRELAASLTVTREADRTILTQNTIVNVRSSITAVTKSLDASFEDLPPAGAALGTCSTKFTEGKAFYSFNLPVIGESFFRGVLVTCSDLFFTHKLLVARNAEQPQTHHVSDRDLCDPLCRRSWIWMEHTGVRPPGPYSRDGYTDDASFFRWRQSAGP